MLELTNGREATLPRSKSWRVVPYRAEHGAQVAELQRHLWSPDIKLNTAYLEWKYHQNPYIREPILYLAFAGDRLAGMRGAFGTRWEAGAETFTLPYPDDLVIDPDFRKQGLHRVIMNFALNDLAKRGYRYVINLSASPITRQASMKMRWRNAGGMISVHRRGLSRAAADLVAGWAGGLPWLWRRANDLRSLGGPRGEHLFDRFDSRTPPPARSRQAGSWFVQATPLAEEMARLVARLPKRGGFRHVRDQTYFSWRFRNPLRSYRYLYAGGDRIKGYLVLQRPLNGRIDRVSIVDWEAESESVLEELLDAAIECGEFPALCVWRLGTSPAVGRWLDRHGFGSVGSRHESYILVRSVQDANLGEPWMLGGRHLDDASQWDMRMIYSMQG